MMIKRNINTRTIYFLFIILIGNSPYLSAQARETFETPNPGNSVDYLGQTKIQHSKYRVLKNVSNNGFINNYQIESESLSLFNVSGSEFALERIHELDVILAIGEIKKTDAFINGFQASVDTTIKAAEQVLTDPAQAIKNLEKGFSRFLDNVGSTVSSFGKKSRRKSKKEKSENNLIKEFLGVNSGKRKLAVDFGVDPYTSNEVLQQGLDDLAMATVAGGASLDLALQSAPGAANAVRTTAGMMEEGSQHYLLSSPKILKFNIAKQLSYEDFSREKITNAIDASRCSLRHITSSAGVLIELGKKEFNQGIFSWALGARKENECRRRLHMMELVWDYLRNENKISRVWTLGDQLYWSDESGNDVIPIVADHLFWTGKLENLLAELKSLNKVAWTSGQTSDRVKTEMDTRGILLSTNRFSAAIDRGNIGNSVLNESQLPIPEQNTENEIVAARQELVPAAIPVDDVALNNQQNAESNFLDESQMPATEQIPEKNTLEMIQEQSLAAKPVDVIALNEQQTSNSNVLSESQPSAPEQNLGNDADAMMQEQSPAAKPVDEIALNEQQTRDSNVLIKSQLPAPEQNLAKDANEVMQEQSPEPKPVDKVASPSSSIRLPEQTKKATVVSHRGCWKHPKLGIFTFELIGQSTQLKHKKTSAAKPYTFGLTSIGNQLYWKTDKGEHVFIKGRRGVTLITNINSKKAESILTKCNSAD